MQRVLQRLKLEKDNWLLASKYVQEKHWVPLLPSDLNVQFALILDVDFIFSLYVDVC